MADRPQLIGESVGERGSALLDHPYLKIIRRDIRPGIAVCLVSGELDLLTGPLLQNAFYQGGLDGADVVIVDLSSVGFLSAFGARTLIHAADWLRAQDRWFTVVTGHGPVGRVLDLTGYGDQLVVKRTLADVLPSAIHLDQGQSYGR